MMIFAEDESISSWICRQVVYKRLEAANAKWLLLSDFIREKELHGDIDFNYSEQDAERVAELVGALPSNFLDQARPSPFWLLSDHRARASFCKLCMKRDFLTFRVPVWRREWSTGWYVVCPEHKVPMTTLKGPYGVLRTEDRNKSASRYLLESRDLQLAFAESRELSTEGVNYQCRQVQALVGMAWSLQRPILAAVEAGDINQQQHDVVLDLCSAMLRPYTPSVEGTPYVQWIAQRVFGRESPGPLDEPVKRTRVDYEQFQMSLEQSAQTPCAHRRMIALGLTACILGCDDVYPPWADFVDASRQRGLLVADSPDWLYCAVLGPVGSHARMWHLNRIRAYAPPLREYFLELINSPVPSSRLKNVSRNMIRLTPEEQSASPGIPKLC
ncbi:TniQ family protein [Pseudomonas aeruginosa]